MAAVLPAFLVKRKAAKTSEAGPARRVASYARYSSENQDKTSIADQQRECRESARMRGDVIDPELEFKDEAVSGTILQRDGLDRLRAAAERGEISTIYVHSLSRLSRDSVFTQSILNRLQRDLNVRVIAPSDGVDTRQEQWGINVAMTSLQSERYITDLSSNVHRGQSGTILAGFSGGDFRFGYKSVPSPDGAMKMRGGELKPRKVYAIHEEEAKWVRRIFHLFTVERCSLKTIVAELNRHNVPKDHRSSTTKWTRHQVISVLRSPKYIGWWPWGELKNRRKTGGKVVQELRTEEERQKWVRELPHLRVVDHATFLLAQERLDQNAERMAGRRKKNGQLNGSDGRTGRVCLMTRVFQCEQCNHYLYVGGGDGCYLLCPGHRDGVCTNHMQLPIKTAEELIHREVSKRIEDDPAWTEAIVQASDAIYREQDVQLGDTTANRQLEDCQKKLNRLIRLAENDEDPKSDLNQRIVELQTEKNSLNQKIALSTARRSSLPTPPTREFIREQLQNLPALLKSTAAEANEALRDLLAGPIRVSKATRPGRQREFWRGKLKFSVEGVLRRICPMLELPDSPQHASRSADEITLDFCRELKMDGDVERAWELLQQGFAQKEIAAEMDLGRQRVNAIMKVVAETYGNGQTVAEMCKQYVRKAAKPRLHETLAEPAMELFQQGRLLGEIADRFKTNRNMITAALRFAHAARGVPMPDGRTRRISLDHKGQNPHATRTGAREGSDRDASEEPSSESDEGSC